MSLPIVLSVPAAVLPWPTGLPLAPGNPTEAGNVLSGSEQDKVREFLCGVQAGILATRGRGDHVALLWFHFSAASDAARRRASLRAGAERVTTAWEQYCRGFKSRDAEGSSVTLGLTGTGLSACDFRPRGFSSDEWFPPDWAGIMEDGMRRRAVQELLDPPDPANPQMPADWDPLFLGSVNRGEPHGLWIIGANSASALRHAIAAQRTWCEAHDMDACAAKGEIMRGSVRRTRDARTRRRQAREAFGFRDGFSQAAMFAPPGGKVVPPTQGNPAPPFPAPLALEKIFLEHGRHRGGSFLVVRKLEQNLVAFRAEENARRTLLGNQKGDPRLAPAQLVGRFRNGLPLIPIAMQREMKFAPHLAAFSFKHDSAGNVCPFSAHVRRANPRENDHSQPPVLQILRRSVVYGSRRDLAPSSEATGGVGMLFMAYMRDLTTFEKLQGGWLASPLFEGETGRKQDALVFGQDVKSQRFVVPRGGAYCYMPPLSWLRGTPH